ncbi:hypothetical protein CW731_02665 [Polaribacter sp. ALD11]|uniref:hypothetical protein n=1 Tax=Polaribacter sp. ALD11 TaxID=2058137 RepID=UPI000C310738|nr:hypothetical protein [Polaribacter sp. ALD11]AUC84268.1 hypothetical protein CW731_02665 [Polaribacter sp. ALD11]
MRKIILFFIIAQFSLLINAQEKDLDSLSVVKDTTKYVKTVAYTSKREFKEDLKSRYSEEDFIYTEEKDVPKEKESSPTDWSFLKGFASFMQAIFPFLLGGFVVFIILKLVLGAEIGFWNFKKGKKKVAEKLVYEDEDIHEVDLEALLQQAILEKQYRLAVRYSYLSILKELSNKKLIDYHKDKTNAAYKFELEKGNIRERFSYLSYVYNYVWYGEFPINNNDFSKIQEKYVSFKKYLNK